MQRIKCGHCSTFNRAVYHNSTKDVQFCAFQHQRAAVNAANIKATPPVAPQKRPNEWLFKTPRTMVEAMRDGRYCVDVNNDYEFIRVSRPKHGKKKGCLVLQTQHSESYKPMLVIYPSGSVWFAQPHRTARLDMAVMMVAADPYTSAMNYGRIMKVCSRCGKELTDNRSIYYGIGPECEKHWPEIISYIDETRGVY